MQTLFRLKMLVLWARDMKTVPIEKIQNIEICSGNLKNFAPSKS